MDKSNIIRTFLAHGTQVDKEALDVLTSDPAILEYALTIEKEKLPPIITSEFLRSLFISINKKQKLSIDELSQILNYRYDFLRELIENNEELVNLISINKINDKIKHFSVTGVVFEKNNILKLEDNTGQSTFTIDKELSKYIVEDEVIGLVCERHAGTNKVKNVVYPDIPIRKESNKAKTSENCLFISDLHMDSTKFNIEYYKNFINWLEGQKNLKVFILGGISSRNEDISKFLSDVSHPTHLYVEEDIATTPLKVQIQNIEILLTHGLFLQHYIKSWGTTADVTLLNLVRKRNLNPILTPMFYTNSFLLKTIPDIIAIGGVNKPTLTNYKGTTILTNGSFLTEPIYWLINLQTRETFKIDLS